MTRGSSSTPMITTDGDRLVGKARAADGSALSFTFTTQASDVAEASITIDYERGEALFVLFDNDGAALEMRTVAIFKEGAR